MPLTPHILESALLLVATFLIGCVIGYVLRKHVFKASANASASTAPVQKPAQAAVKPAATRKAKTAKPTQPPEKVAPLQSDSAEDQAVDKNVVPDDLKKINGIGPKLEMELNAAGVKTYAQIAGWSAHAIDEMDAKLNARGRIKRQDWVRQAKALVKAKAKTKA